MILISLRVSTRSHSMPTVFHSFFPLFAAPGLSGLWSATPRWAWRTQVHSEMTRCRNMINMYIMCKMHCKTPSAMIDVMSIDVHCISLHLCAAWYVSQISASGRSERLGDCPPPQFCEKHIQVVKICEKSMWFLDFPTVFPCSFWYCSNKSCSFNNLRLPSARALPFLIFFLPAPRHCDLAAVAAGGSLLRWSCGETWPPRVALTELQAALQPTFHLRSADLLTSYLYNIVYNYHVKY